MTINQIASSLLIANDCNWSKSGMGTVFFYVSTPFPLVPAAAVGVESISCFDGAENRAASSIGVGANRYLPDLGFSKLLWIYSHLKSDFVSEKKLLIVI